MRLVFVSFLAVLLLANCSNGAKNAESSERKNIAYTDIKGNKYKDFNQIPDSLRTAEQEAFVKSLADIMPNGLRVENNHVLLKLSKQDYLAQGLSEQYYEFLQSTLRSNNAYIDKEGINDVDKLVSNLKPSIPPATK